MFYVCPSADVSVMEVFVIKPDGLVNLLGKRILRNFLECFSLSFPASFLFFFPTGLGGSADVSDDVMFVSSNLTRCLHRWFRIVSPMAGSFVGAAGMWMRFFCLFCLFVNDFVCYSVDATLEVLCWPRRRLR